jgi:uncharacterized protein (TIGR03435 family)
MALCLSLTRRSYNPQEGRMTRLGQLLVLIAITGVTLTSQDPRFEVASVKPSGGQGYSWELRFLPGGTLRVKDMQLRGIIAEAYDLRLFLVVSAATVLPLSAQQPAPAFDVASIKRNIGPRPSTSGTLQNTPKGEIRLVWIPARLLVLLAYPLAREVVGLPSWASADRYDVTVKGPPDATREHVTQMWQTLLADRMKLTAHYEPRDGTGYKLVVARSDGKLGRDLKPSTLDCSPPDPAKPPRPPQAVMDAIRPGRTVVTAETERLLMSQCHGTIHVGNTSYAGGLDMDGLVLSLRLAGIREPIENHTGLEGLYSFKLTFSDQPLDVQATTTDNQPSIFTALQEQLGLKLERTTVRSPAVIIDHIERPSEN